MHTILGYPLQIFLLLRRAALYGSQVCSYILSAEEDYPSRYADFTDEIFSQLASENRQHSHAILECEVVHFCYFV